MLVTSRLWRKEKIVIEPLEPAADEYFGALRIFRWSEDLDGFVVEGIKKW